MKIKDLADDIFDYMVMPFMIMACIVVLALGLCKIEQCEQERKDAEFKFSVQKMKMASGLLAPHNKTKE